MVAGIARFFGRLHDMSWKKRNPRTDLLYVCRDRVARSRFAPGRSGERLKQVYKSIRESVLPFHADKRIHVNA